MVIDLCTLNVQSCMIPFCVRSNTLIKMVYHLLLYDKCIMNYDQICIQMLEVIFAQIDSAFYAHSQGYHQK